MGKHVIKLGTKTLPVKRWEEIPSPIPGGRPGGKSVPDGTKTADYVLEIDLDNIDWMVRKALDSKAGQCREGGGTFVLKLVKGTLRHDKPEA